MRLCYNLLTLLLTVAGLPFWIVWIVMSPKRRRTVLYRLGVRPLDTGARIGAPGPEAPHLWIHALSVGELHGADSLIRTIHGRHPDWRLTLSVSTLTGYELARQQVAKQVHHLIYFPYDLYPCVRRAVDRIDPTLTVWVESDLWPNLIWRLTDRKVPLVLANARLSQRTFNGYRRFRWIFVPLLSHFAHIAAQSGDDARRFSALDIEDKKLTITGNIKFDQSEAVSSQAERVRNSEHLGVRKGDRWMIWGSTHPGEEAALLKACHPVMQKHPRLRLLIAPRNPQRAVDIQDLCGKAGWQTALWTQLSATGDHRGYRVLVVDVIGVLRTLYALTDVAIIGGSFIDYGGHNPLEPAFYAKPIIFGPHMGNFSAISDLLVGARGAIQVSTTRDLSDCLLTVLEDSEYSAALGSNAKHVLQSNAGAVKRTLALIENCITR
jgi:3-deoxy-D-manno-octulosonic-acid transferase